MELFAAALSIIGDEYGRKVVRMGNLAIVASHHVNGVAAIHTELIKETIFKVSAIMAPVHAAFMQHTKKMSWTPLTPWSVPMMAALPHRSPMRGAVE